MDGDGADEVICLVLTLWVGLFSLAAIGIAVREAAGVFVFDAGDFGMYTREWISIVESDLIDGCVKAIMIWTPYTNTYGQYIASKILQGFFGAPIESLCEISVADIYFQHERGTYIGLYSFMLAGSNFLAPVFAGFITDGQDWQWVFYWCAIFLAIGFVFNFFLMEETNYGIATARRAFSQLLI